MSHPSHVQADSPDERHHESVGRPGRVLITPELIVASALTVASGAGFLWTLIARVIVRWKAGAF